MVIAIDMVDVHATVNTLGLTAHFGLVLMGQLGWTMLSQIKSLISLLNVVTAAIVIAQMGNVRARQALVVST